MGKKGHPLFVPELYFDEIIKYDFSEKKEKSKSIWLTIKKVFGL